MDWPLVGRSQVEREKHLGSLAVGQKTKPANQEKGWRCQSPVAKWEKHSCHLYFYMDGGSAYDSQFSIGLSKFEGPFFGDFDINFAVTNNSTVCSVSTFRSKYL